MDAWAKRYGASASFVCVSCAGPQLATQFGNQQRLQHCPLSALNIQLEHIDPLMAQVSHDCTHVTQAERGLVPAHEARQRPG